MSFQSRTEFITAQASEKITLAHVHATARLVAWVDEGSDVYSKVVPHFVSSLKIADVELTRVDALINVIAGTFFYDPQAGEVSIKNPSLEDPADVEMIVTYRFFYSNGPIDASWNLEDGDTVVPYTGIIEKSPGYKQKVGIDQKLTSLVGKGDLVLINDGQFDDIFDKYYFENQLVRIYSWNRDLDYSDAKLLFRGRVSDKTFGSDKVTFKIKDNIFDLKQNIPQSVYDDTDTVNDSVKGDYKRWIYGRVDGLKLQSIDQIGDGYLITGTGAASTGSDTLTGTGTSFLADLSPGDAVTVGTQEFTIEAVASDTSATLSNEPDFNVSAVTITVNPEIPTVLKNRDFLIADHECSELAKTLLSIKQLNRVELSDTTDLVVGDLLEFDTGERIAISSFATGTTVVLVRNLIFTPTISSIVSRPPVQKVFIDSNLVNADGFELTNSSELSLTLDDDVEFNLARIRAIPNTLTFTNASRTITYTGARLDETIKSRDWIRPESGNSTYYEILDVDDTTITIRTAFDQATTSQAAQYKSPEYVGDDTILSVDALGRTEDGTATGTWIKTAPQVIKDALATIGLTDIDESSFIVGQSASPQVISLPLPLSPGPSSTTVKQVLDAVNQSVLSTITTDNNLDIKYSSLLAVIADDVSTVSDKEITSWSVQSVTGRLFQNSVVNYRHLDVSRANLEEGNSVVRYSSDFVKNYLGTEASSEIDARLYNQTEAQTRANREVYYNRLGKTEVTIKGDLRLDVHEIGDSIKLDRERLYKRLGDQSSRQKIMKVVGKTANGNEVVLILNDVANIYNASSIITPNTAPDYASSTSEEKIKYGYITDTQGIIDDEEETAGINLIS